MGKYTYLDQLRIVVRANACASVSTSVYLKDKNFPSFYATATPQENEKQGCVYITRIYTFPLVSTDAARPGDGLGIA